jgi:hypothetical protein
LVIVATTASRDRTETVARLESRVSLVNQLKEGSVLKETKVSPAETETVASMAPQELRA